MERDYIDLDQWEAEIINNDDTFSAFSETSSTNSHEEDISSAFLAARVNIVSKEQEGEKAQDLVVSLPISYYYNYQKNTMENIYGENTLNSSDIYELYARLYRNDYQNHYSDMNRIYSFVKDCNLSRADADRLIDLINEGRDPDKQLHHKLYCWKTVERHMKDEIEIYTIKTKTIKWPEHFRMSEWNHPNTSCPEDVVIRLRDPLELIAEQCVSPFLQFLWKDHINIDCYEKFDSKKKKKKLYRDIMSSEWAKEALAEIRQKDPNGILLPIIFYWDGVALGQHMDTLVCPVMGTLGWYSKTLFQKDISKFVIGFIEKINNISEAVLINHLVTVCRMSSTKAKENIAFFKKQIFFEFWQQCLETIQPAANRGIELKILGQYQTRIFYPRIAFHVGDNPAQHDVASIKCASKVQYPCIRCMYDLRKGGAYVYNADNFRIVNEELLNNIRIAQSCYLKSLKGEVREAEEKEVLVTMQKKGYHPIYNPFFDAPFGPNNSIYNSPPDLMHLFSAGLIKSVLLWTMTIIDAVSKYEGTDYNFSQNAGLFDMRLRQFPAIPRNIPHMHLCKFAKGLMKIVQNKNSKEKSYATGSGGNFRSSEYVVALFQSRFAVSPLLYYYNILIINEFYVL